MRWSMFVALNEVNIALVCEGEPHTMIGKWVLVHVGFAMSIVNEEEAKDSGCFDGNGRSGR